MDDALVVRAIEQNAAELLMAMGATGGGEQRESGGVRWTIGGSPLDYHNAVVEAELSGEAADAAIVSSLALMKSYDVPGTWHVGPSMRPTDLANRLLTAGFAHAGSEPGMAAALANLTPPSPHPTQPSAPGGTAPSGGAAVFSTARTGSADAADLEVRRVMDDEELGVWVGTLGRGFGEGVKEAEWVGEVYRREGYADPWRHYLGLLDGKPVATATVYLAAGVAGVYFVMTVPEARRRGIGAAITHAALVEARDSGYEYAVLGSSPAGRSVYAGLGFREYCSIDLYEWSPTNSPAVQVE